MTNLVIKLLACSVVYGLFLLQTAGADEGITAKDYYKFYASVRKGDIVAVDHYLSKGLDPNWKEEPYKSTPLLHKAVNCSGGFLNEDQKTIINKLLKAGIDPNSVDIRRNDTALILLTYCKENSVLNEIAQLLIDQGADSKHQNQDNNSAFRLAVSRDNESLALILLPFSSLDKQTVKRAMLNDMHTLVSRMINKNNYLYDFDFVEWAIRHDFEDVIVEVLSAGADPNSFLQPPKNYTYPILYAADLNRTNLVKIFHRFGADVQVKENSMDVEDIARKRKNSDLLLWLQSIK